ncbi:Helix-turn-helix domain protein [Rhodobacteraceae bacterium KLH11]|nr:Helix-turn-helix domain protein [Rhodobacteraceae bacterium KLH11]
MTDRTFAERLKAVIDEDPTLTEAGLATKAGLSNSVIRKLFKGNTQNPRVDTAIKICEALGTTLEDFMSGAFQGEAVPADEEAQRIRTLMSQLTPEERVRLVTYGEGMRDARQMAPQETPLTKK